MDPDTEIFYKMEQKNSRFNSKVFLVMIKARKPQNNFHKKGGKHTKTFY